MPTWISPKTFADDDYLTFAELHAAMGVNGDLHWLREALRSIDIDADSGQQTVNSAMAGCRVVGGNQQIADSTWTDVTWSQQTWGRWNGFERSFLLSNHPTFVHLPAKPHYAFYGYVLLGAHIAWTGNTTGTRGMRIISRGPPTLETIYLLGSKDKEATGAGAVMTMTLVTVDGPTFDGINYGLQVYQDSGDSLSLESVASSSVEMWVVKVGSGLAT